MHKFINIINIMIIGKISLNLFWLVVVIYLINLVEIQFICKKMIILKI
jgi:hypothetical protein